MKNVSDLLKSESFRKNQLHKLLLSKFKEGVIPTDEQEFLNCFTFIQKPRGLQFLCRLKMPLPPWSIHFIHKRIKPYRYKYVDDRGKKQVEIIFRTDGVLLGEKDCTPYAFVDENDFYLFYFDFLMLVVQELTSIERIRRLLDRACECKHFRLICINDELGELSIRKYNELEEVAKKRIAQLENQEIKTQEEYIL